jgi:hypothetical protein
MICACVVLDNQVMLLTKRAATKHTFSRFCSHLPQCSSRKIFADNCLGISVHSDVTSLTTKPTLMTQYDSQVIDQVPTARCSDLTNGAHICALLCYTPPNTWNQHWTIDWFIGINACIFESFGKALCRTWTWPPEWNRGVSCQVSVGLPR